MMQLVSHWYRINDPPSYSSSLLSALKKIAFLFMLCEKKNFLFSMMMYRINDSLSRTSSLLYGIIMLGLHSRKSTSGETQCAVLGFLLIWFML